MPAGPSFPPRGGSALAWPALLRAHRASDSSIPAQSGQAWGPCGRGVRASGRWSRRRSARLREPPECRMTGHSRSHTPQERAGPAMGARRHRRDPFAGSGPSTVALGCRSQCSTQRRQRPQHPWVERAARSPRARPTHGFVPSEQGQLRLTTTLSRTGPRCSPPSPCAWA